MKLKISSQSRVLLLTLFGSSLISIGMFGIRYLNADNPRYSFMLWNLFLAWLPLIFAYALNRWLVHRAWGSWQGLLLTALWLGFLPNSFYLVSDLVHLRSTGEVSLLYDAAMFMSFIWNGFILGYVSLYTVHWQLLRRLAARQAHALIGLVLLLSGTAIYLGRSLRWNTWDLLFNPAGIIFDVSSRLVSPASYPQMFTTTLTFFVLLTSIYVVIWQLITVFAQRPSE